MTSEIKPGDDVKLIALVKTLHAEPPNTLEPRSGGGDIETAIKIGRFLRENEWWTHLYHGACVSSCVLAFVGGVRRTVIALGSEYQSGLAVHRFYFSELSPNASKADVSRGYKAMKKAISDYLDEMNISQELLTAIESVPPEEIRFLTEDEMQRCRLTGEDAEWNERSTSKLAYMYGLTSAEYRSREAKAESACTYTSGKIKGLTDYECRDRILLAIDKAELAKRKAIAHRELDRFTNKDEKLKCYRAIMAQI
jgi:hypothetical protein